MKLFLHWRCPSANKKCRNKTFIGSILILSGFSLWIQLTMLFYRRDNIKTRALLISNVSTDGVESTEIDADDEIEPMFPSYSRIYTNLQPDLNDNNAVKFPDTTISNPPTWTQEKRLNPSEKINVPGIHIYLPHLRNMGDYMVPALKVSHNRSGVKLVIGIPTVRREYHDYLTNTLNSLLSNLTPTQALECLIIVFIAEPWKQSHVQDIVDALMEAHSNHIESGLIDIIAPKADFYPSLNSLPRTLNDELDRVRWRTKQNLDYAYLMLYAQSRGQYYIQLEDDVVTKAGFYTYITSNLSWRGDDWFVLKFSPLGFIGKLFHTRDLPFIAEFLLMFYVDKPGDWLLDNIITTKVCGKNMLWKECLIEGKKIAKDIRPSLFQHVGYHSSLKGKVQSLKDKSFKFTASTLKEDKPRKENFNPTPTSIETTITQYMKYKIEYAYTGKGYFWGVTPDKDDIIDFVYDPPINIARYKLVSGKVEAKGQDLFPNDTTVEVFVPNNKTQLQSRFRVFQVVGHFDNNGVAEGNLEQMDSIGVFRIHVNSDMKKWVILSMISIILA